MEHESAFELGRLNLLMEKQAWNNVFPDELEQAYGAHLIKRNKEDFRRDYWPGIVIYNIFLIVDFLVLPEVAMISAFLHFFVVTPLLVVFGFIHLKTERLRTQELVWSVNMLVILAQILFVFWIAQNEARANYQALVLLVVIFFNIERPVSVALARKINFAMLVIYATAMLTSGLPLGSQIIGVLMMIATIYATIKTNARFERDSRLSFLRLLQDQARLKIAQQDAFVDSLTGLHNRRYLESFISAQYRNEETMGVIITDIDHFKLYNDTYGHQAGDDCLREVAAVFAKEMNGSANTVIRYGGEEFLVLLPSADFAATHAAAERLRSAVEARAITSKKAVKNRVVTMSFGVASGAFSVEVFPELLRQADVALYEAKHAGRNRVHPPLDRVETSPGIEEELFDRRGRPPLVSSG